MISNNFLFYGPKGCGKTSFASATFGEFSKVDPAWITVEIKKGRILESPIKNIKETFSTISQYHVNGILIEDLDLLISGLQANMAARQILIEGIKKIGENQVIIATTRNPDNIGDVILSEFDAIIPFYYPSEADRFDILRVHTQVKKQVPLAPDVDLLEIAKRTSWFSGGELENAVAWAINNSRGNIITLNVLNAAIDFFSSNISVPKRIQEMRDLVDFAIKHCTVQTIREELISYAKTLNILSPASQSDRTNVDLNKVLELKPNFFGLGVNINEIISAVRRKFKRNNK